MLQHQLRGNQGEDEPGNHGFERTQEVSCSVELGLDVQERSIYIRDTDEWWISKEVTRRVSVDIAP